MSVVGDSMIRILYTHNSIQFFSIFTLVIFIVTINDKAYEKIQENIVDYR